MHLSAAAAMTPSGVPAHARAHERRRRNGTLRRACRHGCSGSDLVSLRAPGARHGCVRATPEATPSPPGNSFGVAVNGVACAYRCRACGAHVR